MKKAPKPKHYDSKVKKPGIDLTAKDAVEKVWNEFWLPLYENKEPSLDQIKEELAGYYFIMTNVSLVYEEITGGRLSNIKYEAKTVIGQYVVHVQEMAKEMKQTIFDDLKDGAVDGKISLDELAKYLEVDNK